MEAGARGCRQAEEDAERARQMRPQEARQENILAEGAAAAGDRGHRVAREVSTEQRILEEEEEAEARERDA